MVNRRQSRQEALYELTKEELEALVVPYLETQLGESLPFVPNKITVQYSDPTNGVYQVRIEFNDDLPQVLPLRGPPDDPGPP